MLMSKSITQSKSYKTVRHHSFHSATFGPINQWHSSILCTSVHNSVRSFWVSLSGACFLISSDDALVRWRRCLCCLESPPAIVPPEGLRSGRGGSWLGCNLSRAGGGHQCGCMRQRGLAPFLRLPRNLAALQERMEGGGPEAGFVNQWVEVIWGGSLTVEGESGTDQTIVAPPVIAAVAVETRAASRGVVWLARRVVSDASRADSTSGHPGQDHIDESPQEQTDSHGNTERYDQGDWKRRGKKTNEWHPFKPFSHVLAF